MSNIYEAQSYQQIRAVATTTLDPFNPNCGSAGRTVTLKGAVRDTFGSPGSTPVIVGPVDPFHPNSLIELWGTVQSDSEGNYQFQVTIHNQSPIHAQARSGYGAWSPIRTMCGVTPTTTQTDVDSTPSNTGPAQGDDGRETGEQIGPPFGLELRDNDWLFIGILGIALIGAFASGLRV